MVCALCVAAGLAWADKIDDLARALRTDSSFRVRAQAASILGRSKDGRGAGALIDALRDEDEGVRAVAAAALGRLGAVESVAALRALATDGSKTVRAQAERSLALLSGAARGDTPKPSTPSAPSSGPRYFVALSPIAAGKADPDAARVVQARIEKRLAETPRVTLADHVGAPLRRFYVDGNIARLATTPIDGKGAVRTDCDLRFVVATFPERAIKLMATVGGSVDGTSEPSDLLDNRKLCLEDVAQQLSNRVQNFLETQ